MVFYMQTDHQETTYKQLSSKGFKPQQTLLARKTVVVKEEGKKYVLDVQSKFPSVVFQVDGDIIKTGLKCDKLILVNTRNTPTEEWVQIFVELKGTDVIHGMKQLLESVKNPIFASLSNKQRKARLVATSFPSNKSNPKVEELKREFAKQKVDYRGMKPNQEDRL
jgi:hypothetical protein